MAIYAYDGTFDGLMTVFVQLLRSNETPCDILTFDAADGILLGDVIRIGTNESNRLTAGSLTDRQSEGIVGTLCTAYMSELPGFEMVSYNFLRTVSQHGVSIVENLADESIMAMNKITYKVGCEKHRFMGLARFSELSDGMLYSVIEPDHNIAPLLAPHFAARMASHDWMIHDLTRGLVVIYRCRTKRWDIFSVEESSPVVYSKNEMEYRSVWKRYFKEIAIPERKNPACQKRFMPRRYWKHLTEKR